MASLEQRNGNYRVVFRYGGQKFARTLRTTDLRQAQLTLARLEDNLRRAELGTLAIEAGADVPTVMLSSGNVSHRRRTPRCLMLGELLDAYIASIPEESLETSTIGMLEIHVRHLKRLLGVRLRVNLMQLERLQDYINQRSSERGIRGRTVCAVTIKKELTTLRAAWAWAKDSKKPETTDLRNVRHRPLVHEVSLLRLLDTTWKQLSGGISQVQSIVYCEAQCFFVGGFVAGHPSGLAR